MTFRAVYSNAKIFKRIIDTMGSLTGEICMMPTSKGIHAKTLDPSHVVLVDFQMDKSAFDEYECDDNGYPMGLDLDLVKKILGRSSVNDKVELFLNDMKDLLQLKLINESKVRSFTIPLINVESPSLNVPDIQFECNATMDSSILIDAIKDIRLIYDMISLYAHDEALEISAKSDENRQYFSILTNSSQDVEEINIHNNEVKSHYPLNYVDDAIKHLKGKETINLQFSNESPVKIAYDIGGANFGFLIAPRIVKE
jgi:proliferating cell nuclear antigen